MKNISPEIEQALRHLDDAETVTDLAAKDFLMSQYPKPLRPLARFVARIVVYAAQVVTLQQRQFNRHIFEAVRLLIRSSGASLPGASKDLIGDEDIEARTNRELREFLATEEIIAFPKITCPEVSVLLVLYNQAALTLNCLRSLLRSTCQSFEIIIVDNASTDETDQILRRIDGARIIRNDRNVQFLAAANQAAREATAKNLLFLNNDTQLDPYAIEAAVSVLKERPDAGAVGARLIHGTGRLQEAGAVVWKTGSCCGYGRGEAPDDSAFTFRRLTDYVSGAFLLTPRHLFESLGGFDLRFAPAYCEDVDYCLSLWEQGRKVVYEPDALVLHLESSSQDRKTAVELMRINQEKLAQKHRAWLTQNHLEDNAGNRLRAFFARYRGKKILFLEDRVPHPEFGSGFPRSQNIIRHLAEDGNFVSCYPIRFPHESALAARSALGCEIEVLSGLGLAGLEGFLQSRAGIYDVLWISRPHNMECLAAIRKAHPEWFSGIRVIYDAEAIFCLREIEHDRMMGRTAAPEDIEKLVARELEPARTCDAVVAASLGDKAWCERLGLQNVQVISYEFSPAADTPGFCDRKGFLFVGPVLEDYCPNADAIERLVSGIFPYIKRAMGLKAQLCLVGHHGSRRVRDLVRKHHDPAIHVAGQVPQVESYLQQARVFIAPTRYSAGIPNKVLEAAAQGLPVVATSLLASQLGWKAETEIVVADSDEEISAACARLHEDEESWIRIRDGALRRIHQDHNPAALSAALRSLLGAATPGRGNIVSRENKQEYVSVQNAKYSTTQGIL